jgi:hypothetical protein
MERFFGALAQALPGHEKRKRQLQAALIQYFLCNIFQVRYHLVAFSFQPDGDMINPRSRGL